MLLFYAELNAHVQEKRFMRNTLKFNYGTLNGLCIGRSHTAAVQRGADVLAHSVQCVKTSWAYYITTH